MVVLGRIVAPYGIAGWVKLHPFGDDPVAWRSMPRWWLAPSPEGADWSPLALKDLRFQGKGVVAKFEGVDDRTAAEKLNGLYFAAPREDLPKNAANEFYWGDLIGLSVVNEADETLGTVASLIESGANQVLVVKDVAVAAGRIRVAWQKDW